MAVRRPTPFRNRDAEQVHLAGLLDRVRAGQSAALVVRGEAGIGKTALLAQVVGASSDFQVARLSGMEAEVELPFAGLHQLCGPMLEHLDALPAPQRSALEVTFGLTSGDVPDRFLVGLATLSLLAEMASKQPLVCVVDDAQWLDAASGQVLGFVARRIHAEAVLMLFGVREPTQDPVLQGLPEVTLPRLSDDDARALLTAVFPGRIDARLQDRIIADTRGNPLALLEMPRDMTAAELANGFPVPRTGDLPSQLEEHFLARIEALPQPTQQLMLLAAADPTGDVALVWRAAQALGLDRDAAAIADAEHLLEIGARVRFRHPLVRSASYAGATPTDRRAAHLALAGATDPQTDPDRRAWHRALAASGPDEEVALELERSASRARLRGGLTAAGAFLQRSAALTEDPDRRADRALAGAQAQVYAGAFDEALRLVSVAEIDAQDELQRARIDLLRGSIALAAGRGWEAPTQLLKAAMRLEPLDVNLARETYLDAWGAAMFVGPLGDGDHLRDVSAAALAAPASSGPQHLPDLLLDGLSLSVRDGLAAAAPTLRKAIAAFASEELSIEKGLQWGVLVGAAAAGLWDFESVETIVRRQSEAARAAGALAPLCFTLEGDVFVMAWRGELAPAAAVAAEAGTLADAIGLHQVPRGALLLAALQGDEPHSSAFIEAAIDLARSRGEGMAVQVGLWAASIFSNGFARYEQALSRALQASEGGLDFFITPWAQSELIEAAVRTGNDVLAADAFERIAETTSLSASDWGRGIFARSKALVSNDEVAELHYREAIDCFSRTPLRPDHARAHLLYGEWLHRRNRRLDARQELRSAHEMFNEMGMLAFAERARRQLVATGETVRKRREDTRNDLTPQEDQIARLAIGGRTNPEIGAQMFISARTVEWHLRKVFAKLAITSRRELRTALPPSDR